MSSFAQRLVAWQQQHGRHHLPWQVHDAYKVWLSEIMLQQTQVSTVLPYFHRFLARFPDVSALASAPLDDVLAAWSGLGYYRRAHHLHQAAQQVMQDFAGQFPTTRAELETLKGVGRSTAAAIAVFAFGQREAILDGNVKRVLSRHHGITGDPNHPQTLKALWQEAEARLPTHDLRAYTQGLMDLGSMVCTRSKPQCLLCPVHTDCYAHQHGQTAQLPSKKGKTTVAEVTACWLLLRWGENLALVQRPQQGIWSGLWSFPEYDDWASAQCALPQYAPAPQQSALPVVEHRFTHRLLRATPMLLTYSQPPVLPATWQWFTPAQALELALPAPIRSLITTLSNTNAP